MPERSVPEHAPIPPARPLRPEEAPAYCVLRREMVLDTPHAFLGAPGDDDCADEAIVASRLSEPENAILVIDDPASPGRFLAVAGVVRSRRVKTHHRAMIWGVYCVPRARGRGLGRSVTDAAIQTARRWEGVTIIHLAASAAAPAAIALYESVGFVRWGVEPDVVRIDGVPYDEVHLAMRV